MVVAYYLEIGLFIIFTILRRLAPPPIMAKCRTMHSVFVDTCITFSLPVSVASMVSLATSNRLYEISLVAVIPIIVSMPTVPNAYNMWDDPTDVVAVIPIIASMPTFVRNLWKPDSRHGKSDHVFRRGLAILCTLLACTSSVAAGIITVTGHGERYTDHACKAIYLPDMYPFAYIFALATVGLWPVILRKLAHEEMTATRRILSAIMRHYDIMWIILGKLAHGELTAIRRILSAIMRHQDIMMICSAGIQGIFFITLMRVQMGKLAGEKTYMENAWSFGQVVAVFLWLPVLLEGARTIYGENPPLVDSNLVGIDGKYAVEKLLEVKTELRYGRNRVSTSYSAHPLSYV